MKPDVLIIGGGVIGLTTAYFLAKEGVRVSLLDQSDFGREASWAGAGILPAVNPKRARSPLGQLRAKSTALFPELSAGLRDLTGIDNGYLRCGGLEVSRSSNALARQRLENLAREERGEGLHCEVLDQTRLHELESALSDSIPGAVFFPEMAQVRNPRHVKALIAACAKRGVDLRPGCPVFAFNRQGERIESAQCPAGPLAANRFLIAGGAWSGRLLAQLDQALAIRPIRGQIALLNSSPPILSRIIMAGNEYLVPRPDGRVLAGSTEEDVGFNRHTTAEAIQHLLNLATTLVPALAHASIERCWAGLRPGSPDGRPFLSQVPGFQNLFLAAGHFRSGIHLSPATAALMTDLLLDRPPTIPLDPFRLDRSLVGQV